MNFEKSIPLSIGFSLNSKSPLDSRTIAQNKAELITIPDTRKYIGMYVYCIDDDAQFKLNANNVWEPTHSGFITAAGIPALTVGKLGDMYIDTTQGDVYLKIIDNNTTLTEKWNFVVNIKGPKGDIGNQGPVGTRGTLWFSGITITGTNTTPTTFPASGLSTVLAGDVYLNTTNSNVYKCTLGGMPNQALWAYDTNIRGLQGLPGEIGPQGEQGETGGVGVQGERGLDGTYIKSGNRIYGETTDLGKSFPDAVADGIDYRVNDVYISTISGDVYAAMSGGLIDTVVWLKTNNINGHMIYYGTVITGTGNNISGATGIGFAKVNDLYINTSNNNLYSCAVEGNTSTAKWNFLMSIKGAQGEQGEPGVSVFTTNISLYPAVWLWNEDSYTQIVTIPLIVDEVLSEIQPIPLQASYKTALSCNIQLDSQTADNKLLFTASSLPDVEVSFKLTIRKYINIQHY